MALQTSGAISLNQIHIEAGGSSGTACTINDSDIRGLIGKASGVAMSFNEWFGASAYLDTQTVTVGFAQASLYTTGGYGVFHTGFNDNTPNIGTISDGTFNPISNKPIAALYAQNNLGVTGIRFELLTLGSPVPNSGWTNMNIAGTNFTRASATYSAGTNVVNGKTAWFWAGSSSSNPFGTTTGVQKVVTFT